MRDTLRRTVFDSHHLLRLPGVLMLMAILAGGGTIGRATAQSALAPPPRGEGLPVTNAAAAGWDVALLHAMEDAIRADSFPRTTSVVIARHGQLLYEGYFGYGAHDLLNDTRSVTKSLTALGVGRAIADGHLAGVDAPAFDYLGDMAPFSHDGPAKRGITLADLLTMSSALACNDNDAESPGNEENMYPLRNWTRWAVDLPVQASYRRDDSGRGPFAYCTAGTFLLGQILQRATGQRIDRYLEEVLLAPLGIEHRQWSQSPTGEYMTGGGLRLRSRDLLKMAETVRTRGVWNGRRVLPDAWVDDALHAHRRPNDDQTYGYLFWGRTWQTACGPTHGPYMSGNGGNAVLILDDLDTVVVVTRQHYGSRGMHVQTNRLLEDYVLAAVPCAGDQ